MGCIHICTALRLVTPDCHDSPAVTSPLIPRAAPSRALATMQQLIPCIACSVLIVLQLSSVPYDRINRADLRRCRADFVLRGSKILGDGFVPLSLVSVALSLVALCLLAASVRSTALYPVTRFLLVIVEIMPALTEVVPISRMTFTTDDTVLLAVRISNAFQGRTSLEDGSLRHMDRCLLCCIFGHSALDMHSLVGQTRLIENLQLITYRDSALPYWSRLQIYMRVLLYASIQSSYAICWCRKATLTSDTLDPRNTSWRDRLHGTFISISCVHVAIVTLCIATIDAHLLPIVQAVCPPTFLTAIADGVQVVPILMQLRFVQFRDLRSKLYDLQQATAASTYTHASRNSLCGSSSSASDLGCPNERAAVSLHSESSQRNLREHGPQATSITGAS